MESASVDVGLAIGQRVGTARHGDLAIEARHGAGAPVMAPPLTTLG